jgi:hypothetical protein
MVAAYISRSCRSPPQPPNQSSTVSTEELIGADKEVAASKSHTNAICFLGFPHPRLANSNSRSAKNNGRENAIANSPKGTQIISQGLRNLKLSITMKMVAADAATTMS